MASLILSALLGLSLGWADEAPAAVDKDTLAMVEAFLKLPTPSLPPDSIPRFLAVEPKALPKKQRTAFMAKRLELYTLRQMAEGKRKGNVRMPEKDCAVSQDAKSGVLRVLLMAGYVEISQDEENYLINETRCTEHSLMCEFSLQIVVETSGGKGAARRRLFLYPSDPAFALLADYRSMGGRRHQTNLFGDGARAMCASGSK